MLIGDMRVSKADGSQTNDLQRDALISAGVEVTHIYEDRVSGKQEERPGLSACLKALRSGDTLLVWHGTHRDMCTGLVSYRTGQDGRREFETSELFCTGVFYNEILIGGDEQCSQGRIL